MAFMLKVTGRNAQVSAIGYDLPLFSNTEDQDQTGTSGTVTFR